MFRFLVLSFATVLILGAATALVSRHIARNEARDDARARSETIANSVAAPIVGSAVRSRDPQAMRTLDTAMRTQIRYGSIGHVVLWDANGRILWAEDATAVGEQHDLTQELRELALRGGTVLKEPGEREPHPGRGEDEDELLEIYVGAIDADGEPFLFEAYLWPDRVDQDYRTVMMSLVPMGLLLLLLLQLATLPSTLALARSIDRANKHRSNIVRRSLASWHEERRALAQELHDEVVQDLAGMSYALPAVIDQLPEGASADGARATGRVMNDVLERSLANLRSTLVDLGAGKVEGPGVVAALQSLSERASHHGLDVTLIVDPDLDVGESAGKLIYRVVREGLRNVEKHAGAAAVTVVVDRSGDQVEILVRDDGRGLSSRPAEDGHVGLQLLGELVAEVGGVLTTSSPSQGGACLRVVVPAYLPDLDEPL